MICKLCKSDDCVEFKEDFEIEDFSGVKIKIKELTYYECKNCKESFINSSELKRVREEQDGFRS